MSDEPIHKREDVDIGNKATSLPEAEITRMTDDIVAALKTVYDPEIPADIYELGLIYKVDIEDDRSGVAVRAGTHCVMPLLARYGLTATCRASFGLYNTRSEVDALVGALRKAQDLFA